MLHGRLTGNKVVNWDIKVGATSNSIVLCSEGWIANIYIYTVCIYIFDYVCYRIWSTVWAAWRCSSLSWSSWPWWPLINSPVIQQLGQISSPLMWPRQLMETGSFSHPTELQVCLPPPTTIYFYFSLFLFNVIRARTFFFCFFFVFQRHDWRRIWSPPSCWYWSISCRDTQSTRRICSTRMGSLHWEPCCRRSLLVYVYLTYTNQHMLKRHVHNLGIALMES